MNRWNKDPEAKAIEKLNRIAEKENAKLDALHGRWFTEDLAAEADKSFARDPDRWSWASVEEASEQHPSITRHSRNADSQKQQQSSGWGRGGKGQRDWTWGKREYDGAKADYERQQRFHRNWEDARRYDERIRDEASHMRDKMEREAEVMRERAQERHDRRHDW